MHTEPIKADPPKRKRRRFQFSLRTLMIGVTLLAVPSDTDMERFRAAFPEAQLARFTSGRFVR